MIMKSSKSNTVRIVFAGGGTGGHIYPGIAVADALRALFLQRGVQLDIYWLGNRRGMDRTIIEKNLVSEGGSVTAFLGIFCGKLRRYFSFQNFLDAFKILYGCIQSVWMLKKLHPDIVFSKGGFVSVPPCIAAWILRIPYYTHECDCTPGLATRLNAGGAARILLSYKETLSYLKAPLQKKCLVTGNPVRPVFYEDASAAGLKFLGIEAGHSKPVLLVLGGSLGAQQINTLVSENLGWLTERFIVVHQTGQAFADQHPDVMAQADENYKPYAFLYQEMPSVVQAADVVLSRAGANSLWECAACAKPMVLVPLCGSGTRGDQLDNARFFEKQGAAVVLAGAEADADHLKLVLEPLCSAARRDELAAACRMLCGSEKPAEKIAQVLYETALKGIET